MSATAGLTETSRTTERKNPIEETTREERIRVRAYELFLARNGASGDAEGDWFRAAAEIDVEWPDGKAREEW